MKLLAFTSGNEASDDARTALKSNPVLHFIIMNPNSMKAIEALMMNHDLPLSLIVGPPWANVSVNCVCVSYWINGVVVHPRLKGGL